MTMIATGIDLAKNVFAVHGVSARGVVQMRQPKVARGKVNALIGGVPPGVIGMEACSGAPKLVTPYRMSGKRGKTTQPTRRRSAKRSSGRTCASCRSRPRSSRRS